MEKGKEIFIDAESGFQEKKTSYEEILNRQIRKTSDVLSGELRAGIIIERSDKSQSMVDTRDVAINSVKTLMGLMQPFSKSVVEEINTKLKEFSDHKKVFGETEIDVRGRGKVKISSMLHDGTSVYYAKILDDEVGTYRIVFNLLIKAYDSSRREIQSYSSE